MQKRFWNFCGKICDNFIEFIFSLRILMNKILLLSAALLLTACGQKDWRAPKSKGICQDINYCVDGKCKKVSDEMYLGQCQVLGGKFISKD